MPGVLAALLAVASARAAPAQVVVRPTGVNVASQGATTVFLTFDGLAPDQSAAEAFWCGELIDARPDVGLRCDPATLFGRLPLRFDRSQRSAAGRFTDVMTIPPSVARRAYQEAVRGRRSDFFYVRRFVNARGGPDVYVAVTCRLTGGGATTPLSLTDVRLAFAIASPVPVLQPEVAPPSLHADIAYTGTGRLQGRWEVVRPGERLPDETDLLTEGTLPLEQRAMQRRFMQLERFNLFLPPGGRVRLPGPDPARLPRDVDGQYLVLLRVEASDDRDGITDPAGVSSGPVASGAVAGFPLPTLRYLVGTASATGPTAAGSDVGLLLPADAARLDSASRWSFGWRPVLGAVRYRLEVDRADGTPVFAALVSGEVAAYRPPPFLAARAGATALRWRVLALDAVGREVARSGWRALVLAP